MSDFADAFEHPRRADPLRLLRLRLLQQRRRTLPLLPRRRRHPADVGGGPMIAASECLLGMALGIAIGAAILAAAARYAWRHWWWTA